MNIGVLALQGDFLNHVKMLKKIGVDSVLVRVPEDLCGVDGIVIPGGESTTISMLLLSSGLLDPLGKLLDEGMGAFGTCAGMIILARTVADGRIDQVALDAIPIAVRRNGFGRQIASFETDLDVKGVDGPMRASFIRAPVVEEIGTSVEVLASVNYSFPDSTVRSVPVVCREGNVLVCSFHPEVVEDERLHRLFVEHL